MASFTYSTLLKFGPLGATFTRKCNLAPLAFQARHIQGGSKGVVDTVKKGVNETLKIGENLKNKACSTAEEACDNASESQTGTVDRAKKSAKNAWESAKGSAEGMADKDSAMAVEVDGPRLHRKDDVEMAKRSMNTKKDDN